MSRAFFAHCPDRHTTRSPLRYPYITGVVVLCVRLPLADRRRAGGAMPTERGDWSIPAASLSPITPALLLLRMNGCASLARLRFPPVNPRLVTANKLARRMSKPEGSWTGQGSRIARMAIVSQSLPECSPRLWPSWRSWIGSFVRGTARQKGINVGDNSSANF